MTQQQPHPQAHPQAPPPQPSTSPSDHTRAGHRPRSKTGMIVTLVVGALLTVSGPILGILIGSFALVPSALGYAENMARLSPTATVELDAGESVLLLAPVDELGAADHDACTARAGDLEADVACEPASALNTRAGATRYESFARVTADESGAYTLSCGTGAGVIAAPPFELGSFLGPLGWWTAGGIVVSVVGIVLTIVGIVGLARAPRASRA